MGTEKRDRQKAQKAARIEAERAAEAKAKRNRQLRNVMLAGVVIVAVMLAISLTSCSSDSSDGSGTEGDDTTTSADAPSGEAAFVGYDGADDDCPATTARTLDFEAAPEPCIDEAKTYTAAFETSEGDFTAELDPAAAPITVNNFVTLARNGYFDGVDVFRLDSASGLFQTGSPHTQSNADQGPGYTIPDEGVPWGPEAYGPGALAMANSGPDSGSAQFFVVVDEKARYLGDQAGGAYTVFGQVTEGLDVLGTINSFDGGGGVPTKQVLVERVTISAS